jgi:membrane-bound lytic murein transglycosylase D
VVIISLFLTLFFTSQLHAEPTAMAPGVQTEKIVKESSPESGPSEEHVLKDLDNRVSDVFPIPEKLLPPVTFWFRIYTTYHSYHAVLHDKENLGLVYQVLDFEELNNNKQLSRITKASLQKRTTREKIRELKNAMANLGKGKKAKTATEKRVLEVLKNAGITVSRKNRVKIYKNLASNLRTQTGQYDMILAGVDRFVPYSGYILPLLESFDLPPELFAITFLESSFNPVAISKVGAAGPWQFIKGVGGYFMTVNNDTDQRFSTYLSTASAFHLLKQNRKILGSWDLAVMAYNSGTKHLLKAKKSLATKKGDKVGAQDIVFYYDHPHVGFASKNFFSEFLALIHALAYKERFYPVDHLKSWGDAEQAPEGWISKCSVKVSQLPIKLERELNLHFKSRKLPSQLRRGDIVITRGGTLPESKFLKIPLAQLTKFYPKNLSKNLLKDQRCSTK